MRGKPVTFDNVPFMDYWAGRFAMYILGKLGHRALDRKDYHEFNHTFLGIFVLNSGHQSELLDTCIVPATEFVSGGQEFKITLPKSASKV